MKLYLADPTDEAWDRYVEQYLAIIEERYAEDPSEIEELAELARTNDVYLGCSCPTTKNPDVRQCHTVLALRFMKEKFPDLEVGFLRRDEEGTMVWIVVDS